MTRLPTILWIALVAAMGAGLFVMKYSVKDLEDRLNRINREIVTDQEAIHVLKAEWAHLNRPDRLDELARRYLELEPVRASQIVDLADLPLRIETFEAAQQTKTIAPLAARKTADARPLAPALHKRTP